MLENEKFSDVLKTHIDFYRNLKTEYDKCVEKVRVCDLTIQDYLHSLEFDNLTYKQRARISTQIRNCRRERRKYKDRMQVLRPVVTHIKDNYKVVIETFSNILGDIRKIEEIQASRVYHKRIPENSSETINSTEDDKTISNKKDSKTKKKSKSNARYRKK